MNHIGRPVQPMLHGERVSKETAEYRKGTPFRRCGLCYYMNGDACDVVRGSIQPYMSCKYFMAKSLGK